MDIKGLLNYINPAELTYQEWVNVGMALKQEGLTAYDWDNWSKNDHRYKVGECYRKWDTFNGSSNIVTGGTIFEYAVRGGFTPESSSTGYALDWDDIITRDDEKTIVDQGYIEEHDIPEPKNWEPKAELIKYLETLFHPDENVGYVTSVYEMDGRLSPTKGHWDRTAKELIEKLRNCEDISYVIGDCNPQAGAWIRFNPLDGLGIKNDNVSDFRYALVESDSLSIGKQYAIMKELELPIATLTHSGKKSLHAIVKIQAKDLQEYKARVDFLYKICDKNGLKIDTQNKNPSRLSRMPGVLRNGAKQFLIATNIGKSSFNEWEEWVEAINDNLPNPEGLSEVWDNMPQLADCLIENVLRKGHKMLIAGPSKAGKSFALIQLTIAIAEGYKWLGFNCTKGKVLYVNLELDRASCLHRFKDVYTAMGIAPTNLSNIDIWNLRGKSVPLDKLAPKLIRRAEKKNYTAIIIDPIYKIITGDENSANQMAEFCNQFDLICTSLKAATIYCHHHSKGSQSGKKSMDRASGSGVFARDPDALIDLVELELNDNIRKAEAAKAKIKGIEKALDKYISNWQDDVGQDDRLSPTQMYDYASGKLNFDQMEVLGEYVANEQVKIRSKSAWRIEGTLREFARFEPVNLWFDYPIHKVDETGILADIKDESLPGKGYKQKMSEGQKGRKGNNLEAVLGAFKELQAESKAKIEDVAGLIGLSEKSIRRYITKDLKDDFTIENGFIIKKE